MKHLLAITIALLPSAVLAEQFTPEQMLDVMTKSPSNRNVRVHDVIFMCLGYYPQCGDKLNARPDPTFVDPVDPFNNPSPFGS